MIIRLLVVDPNPQPGRSDVLCYQVPEKSREYELLVQMFEDKKIEYAKLEWKKSNKPRRKKKDAVAL